MSHLMKGGQISTDAEVSRYLLSMKSLPIKTDWCSDILGQATNNVSGQTIYSTHVFNILVNSSFSSSLLIVCTGASLTSAKFILLNTKFNEPLHDCTYVPKEFTLYVGLHLLSSFDVMFYLLRNVCRDCWLMLIVWNLAYI
jgi:hypothetical protein